MGHVLADSGIRINRIKFQWEPKADSLWAPILSGIKIFSGQCCFLQIFIDPEFIGKILILVVGGV